MRSLFQYNWQVRDEWFDALCHLPIEELNKERLGGVGSIRRTFFHILDVEYSWLRACMGLSDVELRLEDCPDIPSLRNLSDRLRPDLIEYLNVLAKESEDKLVFPGWIAGKSFAKGEVIRHVMVHEVHHIGQLSVWSKDIRVDVVSANFIGRELAAWIDSN